MNNRQSPDENTRSIVPHLKTKTKQAKKQHSAKIFAFRITFVAGEPESFEKFGKDLEKKMRKYINYDNKVEKIMMSEDKTLFYVKFEKCCRGRSFEPPESTGWKADFEQTKPYTWSRVSKDTKYTCIFEANNFKKRIISPGISNTEVFNMLGKREREADLDMNVPENIYKMQVLERLPNLSVDDFIDYSSQRDHKESIRFAPADLFLSKEKENYAECSQANNQNQALNTLIKTRISPLLNVDIDWNQCKKVIMKGIAILQRKIGGNLKQLQSLNIDLKWCKNITDEGVWIVGTEIGKNLKQLQSLDINLTL